MKKNMTKNIDLGEASCLSQSVVKQMSTSMLKSMQVSVDQISEVVNKSCSLSIRELNDALSQEMSELMHMPITVSETCASAIQPILSQKGIANMANSALNFSNTISQEIIYIGRDSIQNFVNTATEALTKQTKALLSGNFCYLSSILNEWKPLYEGVELNGYHYSREEIVTEAANAVEKFEQGQENIDVANNIKEKAATFFSWLKKRAHKVYIVLAGFLFVMAMAGKLGSFISGEELIGSLTEDVIVLLEDSKGVFYVKEMNVNIYEAASANSTVITKVNYGDKVSAIENEKLWIKVVYESEENEIFEGWIAKRNLMTYKDYRFHDDDLLSVN